MSLVEKALRKLQSTREAVAEPVAQAGVNDELLAVSLVATVPQPRPDFATSPPAAPRSDKTIVVDREALRLLGLMAPEEQARRLANEYRQIKRPLIAAAIGKGMERKPNGQLIMVASALPGEGKTFTSINLAMSMALEKDLNVLLIDADVAKPHISRTFGVEKEPGLLDALCNDSLDVESLVIPTDIRGLSLLSAGRQIDTATELLASQHMHRMATALAARDPNRIVLFDSPPLLLTSESRALSGVVGQIVIVVRAATTLRQAVLDALDSLGENLNTKPVGLVLNQCESAPPSMYYGYGDYYGEAAGQVASPPK